jgi:hypothetical protein
MIGVAVPKNVYNTPSLAINALPSSVLCLPMISIMEADLLFYFSDLALHGVFSPRAGPHLADYPLYLPTSQLNVFEHFTSSPM